MALSDDEIDRYARHIVLREVGGVGQRKLKEARVLVIGAGGLGSPVILYLAAAGVGTIGIADFDTVSLSNLQRQIAHRTADVGRPKTESARDAALAVNPNVRIETHDLRLAPDNALALIDGYDIVADGSDNFATRFLINDACFFARKTLVSAAVTEFDGQLATFKAHEPDCPCYRCLFPEAPPPGTAPSCSETGVLGAAAGGDGNAAGAGGDQGDHRRRRIHGRQASDLRSANHALPHRALPAGSGLRPVRHHADNSRAGANPRLTAI